MAHQGGICLTGAVLIGAVLAASPVASVWGKTSVQRRDESQRYYRLGQVQLEQGKTLKAIESADKAVALDPDNADAHYLLGYIRYQQSEYKAAEKEFKKAIKINPYFTDAHNHLGLVYRETKNYDKALAEFDAALKDKAYKNPERIYLNRGHLYLERGLFPEAVENFRKAVALNPGYLRGHLGLGTALTRSGQKELGDQELRKVLALDPDSAEAEEARQLLGRKVKQAGS